MDGILAALNASRQSTLFTLAFHTVAVLAPLVMVLMAVSRDDLRRDVSEALRHVGMSRKEAAITMGISEGLLSLKLSGAKPLALESFWVLGAEFWQWFHLLGAHRVGVPALAGSAARLLRRQARMVLPSTARKGVA
jgi:hypothetical protein